MKIVTHLTQPTGSSLWVSLYEIFMCGECDAWFSFEFSNILWKSCRFFVVLVAVSWEWVIFALTFPPLPLIFSLTSWLMASWPLPPPPNFLTRSPNFIKILMWHAWGGSPLMISPLQDDLKRLQCGAGRCCRALTSEKQGHPWLPESFVPSFTCCLSDRRITECKCPGNHWQPSWFQLGSMGIDVGHYELMSHISEFLPQKEIVVTVILDSNDVREKISGCAGHTAVTSSISLYFSLFFLFFSFFFFFFL